VGKDASGRVKQTLPPAKTEAPNLPTTTLSARPFEAETEPAGGADNSRIVKKLSKMGSARDLPALKQPPRLAAKKSCSSSSFVLVLGHSSTLSTGTSTQFDQFRLISTEKLFRAPSGQKIPSPANNEQLN